MSLDPSINDHSERSHGSLQQRKSFVSHSDRNLGVSVSSKSINKRLRNKIFSGSNSLKSDLPSGDQLSNEQEEVLDDPDQQISDFENSDESNQAEEQESGEEGEEEGEEAEDEQNEESEVDEDSNERGHGLYEDVDVSQRIEESSDNVEEGDESNYNRKRGRKSDADISDNEGMPHNDQLDNARNAYVETLNNQN